MLYCWGRKENILYAQDSEISESFQNLFPCGGAVKAEIAVFWFIIKWLILNATPPLRLKKKIVAVLIEDVKV